jgi:hypothetical protein
MKVRSRHERPRWQRLPPVSLGSRLAAREATAQSDGDYGVPKGLTLRDEIARYFRIGAALFKDFAASPTPSVAAAISFMEGLLGASPRFH